MRLWSLHPKYLDAKGLVALWREALLAQAVLRGGTRGYRHHPQLVRFRAHSRPLAAIGAYLRVVAEEAATRGYRFDRRLVARASGAQSMNVTKGQLEYEWRHLKSKLRARAPEAYRAALRVRAPVAHPLFEVITGPVCDWERT
jgi:hypothetical protein